MQAAAKPGLEVEPVNETGKAGAQVGATTMVVVAISSKDIRGRCTPGSSTSHPRRSRSTIGGGRGCNKFAPVLRGDGTKTAPTGDIFDEPPREMSWIRGKLADHVGDHVVLSTEGAVLVTSVGTKWSYPRPPHSLNDSAMPQQSHAWQQQQHPHQQQHQP